MGPSLVISHSALGPSSGRGTSLVTPFQETLFVVGDF